MNHDSPNDRDDSVDGDVDMTAEAEEPSFRAMSFASSYEAPALSASAVEPRLQRKEAPYVWNESAAKPRVSVAPDASAMRVNPAASTVTTTTTLAKQREPIKVGWQHPQLTRRSLYHCTEHRHLTLPKGLLQGILERLQRIFCSLSLHVSYQDKPIRALCETLEQVELCVSLLECRDDKEQVLLEIQRRSGCCMTFNGYARQILDAAQTEQAATNDALYALQSLSSTQLAECVMQGNCCQANPIFASLEMANDLLQSDRYDARRLGLESVCVMSDPAKTGLPVAEATAKAILLGSGAEHDSNVYPSLQQQVRSLATSESDDCASYHALMAMAHSAEVLSYSEDPNVMTQVVRECSGCDLVCFLVGKIKNASERPHEAYFAVRFLRALCRLLPGLVPENAQQILEDAQQVGISSHAALNDVSGKLLEALVASGHCKGGP